MDETQQKIQATLLDLLEVNRLMEAFNDDMDNLMLDNYRQRKHILLQELLDLLSEYGIEQDDFLDLWGL